MKRKIPFLAFALFAVSCGGGISENSGKISMQNSPEGNIRTTKVCDLVNRDITADINVIFSKKYKDGKVIPVEGVLELKTEKGTYKFNFCGFTADGIHPKPYGNCFLLHVTDTKNFCENIEGVVLYQNGLKIGEIKDIPSEIFCSYERVSKAQFNGITVKNYLYRDCKEDESLPTSSIKVGNLRLSVKLPSQITRNIPRDTDLIRLDISSYIDGKEYWLDPIILSKGNTTVNIKVPAGFISVYVSLWDNDTANGTVYPIAGGVTFTQIEDGGNKTLIVYIPTGVWNLNSTINGISKLQVGNLPSKPSIHWGDSIPDYVIFDKEQLVDFQNWKPYDIWSYSEDTFLKTSNGTLFGFIEPKFNITYYINGTEKVFNLREFSIEAWNKDIGTIPNIVIGRFENGTKATLYSIGNVNCTITFHYTNGTIYSFSPQYKWECMEYLPLSVLSPGNKVSGNYTYDNVTAYVLTDCHCFVSQEECINSSENCGIVNKLEVKYQIQNVTRATATITDLPLPWRDEARIKEFNATCSDDGAECTYYWTINNPKSHPISCYLADDAGNIKININCSNGNFTCTSNNCMWDFQKTSLVVRDEAYVEPLADIAKLEKITYYSPNRELLKDVPGINPKMEDVINIFQNATGKNITIFKNPPITCKVEQGDNNTSFVLSNCSDSSLNGIINIESHDNKVYISNIESYVVYAYKAPDRDTMILYDGNHTISIAQTPATSIYYDNELYNIVNGTWKVFEFDDDYFAWSRSNKKCITFNSENKTYSISPNGEEGNFTITNGTLHLQGSSSYDSRIVQVFFNPKLLILSDGYKTLILEEGNNTECE